jgi:hypothetical protein
VQNATLNEHVFIVAPERCSDVEQPQVANCYFFPYAKTAYHMLASLSARQRSVFCTRLFCDRAEME